MLQVQGFAYAVAEQLATLISAARRHRPGTNSFFRAYTGNVNLVDAVKRLAVLDRSELANLLGVDLFDAYIASILPTDSRSGSETIQIGSEQRSDLQIYVIKKWFSEPCAGVRISPRAPGRVAVPCNLHRVAQRSTSVPFRERGAMIAPWQHPPTYRKHPFGMVSTTSPWSQLTWTRPFGSTPACSGCPSSLR